MQEIFESAMRSTMLKQIPVMVNGKPAEKFFEAYSWDNGRSFCSDPRTPLLIE